MRIANQMNSLALLAALFAAHGAKAAPDSAEMLCGEAMGVYLPSPEGTPAPNIELTHFQFMSPEDRCGRNMSHDELMRLHAAIKPVAASAFADSKSSFGVMVRYTLTPDTPATFEMQVRDAPESERPRLTRFHNESAALQDFHSTSGTVYVVFSYTIHATTKAVLPTTR